MLVLLPPSEGKADGSAAPDAAPLDLDALSLPALTPMRERVLAELQKTSARRNALEVLGLSASQQGELERNLRLTTAPALPVGDLYTGVLYDRLGPGSLDPRRAARSILVFSGLWGALRIDDRVPPYRLSMAVRLPRLGPLAAAWRPKLEKALAEVRSRGELILDLCSATYAAAWNPGDGAIAVRVLRETDGRRTVVSHLAKATRGDVARSLLLHEAEPGNPDELVTLLGDLGYTVELGPTRPGRPRVLDVVVSSPISSAAP